MPGPLAGELSPGHRGRPGRGDPGGRRRSRTTLAAALDGVDVAYYLVHSLGSPEFEDTDRENAENFAAAANGPACSAWSTSVASPPEATTCRAHLRSRTEVGEILLGSGVPTVAFRAAVIIGSGSASFEMLRYLTERLPVMVTPALGPLPHPADRDPRRAALPGRGGTIDSAGEPQLSNTSRNE